MTTDSCPLATALWGARFAGVWLPSCCYTTWGDTTGGRGIRTELAWRRAEKPFGVLRGGQIGVSPQVFDGARRVEMIAPRGYDCVCVPRLKA